MRTSKKSLNSLFPTLLILALGALASACAPPRGAPAEDVLELGEYAPYVQRFESESARLGRPLTITSLVVHSEEMPGRTLLGECRINSDRAPEIAIQPSQWNRLDESERELVIFHELGHCILGREHRTEKTAEGLPVSLMNPTSIGGQLYELNREMYLRELFLGDAPARS